MGVKEQGGALYFATGIDNSGLKSGISQATNMVMGLGRSISKINPFAALGIGTALVFTKILKDATSFELNLRKKLTEAMTISDDVAENYGYFSGKIMQLSEETGESTDVLAKGLYQVISAGFDASEGIKLLGEAGIAAKAGFIDTETAIDGLTTVLNAWNVETEDAMSILDTFFKTVKDGKTTFGEYARSVAQVAPIAANAGVSFKEVSEAVAELTKRGAPTSLAITQIRQAIIATQEILGDTIFETNTLREAFRKMADGAGGSFNKLKKDVGRVEGVNAILSLTSDSIEEIDEKYQKFMSNIEGSTFEAYRKVEKLTQTNWSKIKNIFKTYLHDIGEDIVDWTEKFSAGFLGIFGERKDPYEAMIEKTKSAEEAINSLFSGLESKNISQESKLDIINSINDIYGKYLEKLLTEKSTIEEINEDWKRISAGGAAAAGMESGMEGLNRVITQYGKAFDENIKKFKEKISDKEGGIISANLFQKEIENALDFEIPTGPYDEIQKALETKNKIFEDIYVRYIKNLGVKEKDFDKIIQQLEDNKTKADFKIDRLKESIAKYKETYKILTSESKEEKEAKEEKSPLFDIKSEKEKLEAIKDEFDNFQLLQDENLKKRFIKESEYLEDGLTTWEDYLIKRHELAVDYNEKLLIEMLGSVSEVKFKPKTTELTPLPALGITQIESGGLLNSYNNYLKKLKKDLGEAIDEENKNFIIKEIDRVTTLKNKWTEFGKDVETVFKDIFVSTDKFSNKKLKELVKKIDDALEVEKPGSQNQIELLKQRTKVLDQINSNTLQAWREIPSIFSNISNIAGHFNDSLGDSLKKMEGIASAASGFAIALANPSNPLGIISGGLGIFSSVLNLLDDSARKQELLAVKAEAFRQEIDLQNRALERQLQLLNEISGEERFQAEAETLEMVKQQLSETEKMLEGFNISLKIPYKNGIWNKPIDYDIPFFGSMKEFIEIIENNKPFFDASGEFGKMFHIDEGTIKGLQEAGIAITNLADIEKIIDTYDALIEKRRQLLEEFVGTSVSDITDSIQLALEEGTSFIDAFATTFEESMKGAIMRSFELQYILPLAQEMFDGIGEIMSTENRSKQKELYEKAIAQGKTTGSFDEYWTTYVAAQAAKLRESLQSEVENTGAAWEAINQILEEMGLSEVTGTDPLEGAISRSITEETGSELLGIWTITSIDIRTIRDGLLSFANAFASSADNISKIESNTAQIAENTSLLNQVLIELQEQNSGTSNRGIGI